MTIFESYSNVIIRNYTNLNGRISRREFWEFGLANAIICIGIYIFDQFVTGGLIYLLYGLAVQIPTVCAAVRRLHDTGRSGWWYLLFLTGIGAIVIFVWLASAGQQGSNQYGPAPTASLAASQQNRGYYNSSRAGTAEYSPVQAQQAVSVEAIAGSMYGRTYPIGDREILFGRDSSAWIRFPDNEPGVSRIHCKLLKDRQGGLFLMDCGSTYGTYLQGVGRLAPQQLIAVRPGAVFYLGSKKVGFRIQ